MPDRNDPMKNSKRVRVLATILGSGIVVASSSACGVDSVALPTESGAEPSAGLVQFTPTAPSNALIGVADGTYTFVINPTVDQVVALGPNRLELPANSVCALGVSGYGPTLWNNGCNPQKKSFTLSVTVENSSTPDASVDFQPDMRFNPQTRVALYFYAPQVTAADANRWTILYCPTSSGQPGRRAGTNLERADPTCVNESLTDPDLATQVDVDASVLFRRIKHFSGYRVSGYLIAE
jgi:hypothetical protein